MIESHAASDGSEGHRNETGIQEDPDDDILMPKPYSPNNKKHIAIASVIETQSASVTNNNGCLSPSGFLSCPGEFWDESDSDVLRVTHSA
jgi:hypothetical protein